ncbi:MAG: RIP metalloprotease RseP [Pseudobdellovibrionaceae bacterium]
MESLISHIQSLLSVIVPFVILLGLLIFVHELGHFLVARFFGVRVEVFSLGFGKKILSYKRGYTNYCLSLIPLGGYVKMFGDEPGSTIAEEDKKFAFTHKPVGQRIWVVLAGPLMNLFFAIFLFSLISIRGEELRAPFVGDLKVGSSAALAGFKSGDKILSVNGTEIKTWNEADEIFENHANKPVRVIVQRELDQSTSEFEVTPTLGDNPNILSSKRKIGIVEGLEPNSIDSTVGVKAGSSAALVGLKTGDQITKINDLDIKYWRQVEWILSQKVDGGLKVTAERAEKDKSKEPAVVTVVLTENATAGYGIEAPDLYLDQVLADSPAQVAGLQSGDRIVSINGATLKTWEEVLNTVKSYEEKMGPLSLQVMRGADQKEFQMTPKLIAHMGSKGKEEKRFMIGIVPVIRGTMPIITIQKAENFFAGIKNGVKRTWEVTAMTVISFKRLITAEISPKNIGGVISIGQAASETFKVGLGQFLSMMGIISINLFILNLLPIPILDGGHLMFYIFEAVRGAPLSLRKMEIAQQVGLVILMGLMAFALVNDFSRFLAPF